MDKLKFLTSMKNFLHLFFSMFLASSSAFKVEDDITKKEPTNTKQDLIDFDSWSSDMLNKPQDKTSIVKQGVQTLQLVSFVFLPLKYFLYS